MRYDDLTPMPVQWRIDKFSTLTREPVFSDCFEAGICTWWACTATRVQCLHAKPQLADAVLTVRGGLTLACWWA
jgi:hypothetical protein